MVTIRQCENEVSHVLGFKDYFLFLFLFLFFLASLANSNIFFRPWSWIMEEFSDGVALTLLRFNNKLGFLAQASDCCCRNPRRRESTACTPQQDGSIDSWDTCIYFLVVLLLLCFFLMFVYLVYFSWKSTDHHKESQIFQGWGASRHRCWLDRCI